MVLPEVPPFCECGCGERVRTRKHGVWSRWRPGHHSVPARRGGPASTEPESARSGTPARRTGSTTPPEQLTLF